MLTTFEDLRISCRPYLRSTLMVKMYSVDVNLNIELTTFKILDIRCLYLASPQTRFQSDALNRSAMKAASDKKVNLPNVKFKKSQNNAKFFFFKC